ncbi:hypothetical protein BRC68_12230 [Halobacteriales archaeon QH_6_64_20]|nr:MAG: hypothetical protein BRC68_12230 [Halobacteriales archaeon QH_6_64_20]
MAGRDTSPLGVPCIDIASRDHKYRRRLAIAAARCSLPLGVRRWKRRLAVIDTIRTGVGESFLIGPGEGVL